MPEATSSQRGSVAQAISNGAVQIVRDYTGRGPTKAKTTISDDLVVVVLADILLKAEQTLVDRGKGELVVELRHEFQRTMREDLNALVENALGRKVIAFMSDNHVNPDMAVEVFVLAPRHAGPRDGDSEPPPQEPLAGRGGWNAQSRWNRSP